MLFRPVSILAAAALAGSVVAEPVPKPYKLTLARMSVRNVFGLEQRQDDSGYHPDQTFCGTGTTCAEACGAGFEQCASADTQVHCYNAGASQTCCSGGTGDSCDPGYFCSADTDGATWCCPDGTTVEDCAASFGVTGGLSSQLPVATSTSSGVEQTTSSAVTATSSAVTTTPSAVTTTTSSSGSAATSSTTSSESSSESASVYGTGSSTGECTTYTSEVIHTVIPTASTTGYNTTVVPHGTSSATVSSPATSTSPVQAGASATQGSTGLAAFLAAVGIAALL
ncbi:hypothetical protein BJ170DRAFT_250389 [Xylariales sp. AK1849]|nr:hypothetical protein BJ170DRAFT_250389 [Xylariales sp. AK1849]